jgi:hypothetical protein
MAIFLNLASTDRVSPWVIAARSRIPLPEVHLLAAYLKENGLIIETSKCDNIENQLDREFFISQNGRRVLGCQKQQRDKWQVINKKIPSPLSP